MSQRPLTLKQWQHFSTEISSSKETVEQMSKLYIIIHEKVKSTIKKSITNPTIDFTAEILHHVNFIKNVLDKINKTSADQYLIGVEKEMLKKYQKQLLSLLEQIDAMLKLQQSKVQLNVQKLKRVKEEKRQQHDLKSQLKLSTHRIVRAKSGSKSKTIHKKNDKIEKSSRVLYSDQQQNSNGFFATSVQLPTGTQINTLQQLQIALQQKQQHLTQKLQKSISSTKNGLGLSFHKKYEQNYLDMYFNERKQFADLMFNQNLYNKMITQNESSNNNTINNQLNSEMSSIKGIKIQQINGKLFPQFQIKTKFLKPEVKKKISNIITEIKKELLAQYFDSNIQALKALREGQKLKKSPKKSISTLSRKNFSLSSLSKRKQSQIIGQMKEYSSKFRKTNFNLEQQSVESPQKLGRTTSFISLGKKPLQSVESKRLFINTNAKPFYETQRWNQQVEKKYQQKVMSKLIKAKLM